MNLEELGRLLQPRVSLTTLRRYVAERGDNGMPIETLGSNGVGYEFDLAAVAKWWAEFQAKRDREKEARQEQLDLWALEVYGEPRVDAAAGRLSADERKKLAEAIRVEDYNRRMRGELVERVPLEAALTSAVIETRAQLTRIPAEAAKRLSLTADQTRLLEEIMTRQVNGLAEKFASMV